MLKRFPLRIIQLCQKIDRGLKVNYKFEDNLGRALKTTFNELVL